MKKKVLTISQKFNEYILTNLRTKWGINIIYTIKSRFGGKYASHTKKMIQKWSQKNYIKENNDIIILTDEGSVFADKIISDLFLV